MINKLRPFEGLNIRIPTIIPMQGRGLINQGSGLGLRGLCVQDVPKLRGTFWESPESGLTCLGSIFGSAI